MPRTERLALAAAATVSLVLRGIALLNYRFDSDEPQHLHVAWAWTAGLVQYRDVFDNHAPLFHLASAPLVRLLGERAGILLWMRAAMIPLFAVILFCTWRLGRRLVSGRVGLWAAVLLSLFPPFFLKSLEYRNDNLWTALWMITILVTTARLLTPARSFVVGLLTGTMLAVSIKTVGLALALAAALLITRRISARSAAAGTAGFLIVPLAVGLVFAGAGAWQDLVYCNFQFNSALAAHRSGGWLTALLFPAGVAAAFVALKSSPRRDSTAALLWFVIAFFLLAVVSFWTLVSPRDFLPMMPLLSLLMVARLDQSSRAVLAFATIAALMTAALAHYAGGFRNRTDEHITMMRQVLGVTRPGEPLMDIKGETIYRRRPTYHIFETITRALMARGSITDTAPEEMIAARCYVSQAEGPMYPLRTNRFVHEYFLDLGRLRAAGQWIAESGSFAIAIPGPYVIIHDSGQATGTLDGAKYSGARELSAGHHQFTGSTPGRRVAVIWARAFERGYSPFHLRDRDF